MYGVQFTLQPLLLPLHLIAFFLFQSRPNLIFLPINLIVGVEHGPERAENRVERIGERALQSEERGLQQ